MTLSVLGSSSAGNATYFVRRQGKRSSSNAESRSSSYSSPWTLTYSTSRVASSRTSTETMPARPAGSPAEEYRFTAPGGTADALQLGDDPMLRILTSKRAVNIGSFSVLPFDVEHDAEEPLGFLIEHEEMGRLLFLTDSYLLRYRFPRVTHWLIECNYSEDLIKERLASGAIHPAQYHRTTRSHISYGTCLRTLRANDLTTSRQILLIHLSAGNTNAERCRQSIEEATGLPTMIAVPDMTIEINKTPF